MRKVDKGVSRRDFLRTGSLGVAGLAGLAGWGATAADPNSPHAGNGHQAAEAAAAVEHNHGGAGTVGEVDHEANGFDPHEILYDFDYGEVKEENGRMVREWTIIAIDKAFEIAPGLFFPGWVYGSATSAASKRAGRIVGQAWCEDGR